MVDPSHNSGEHKDHKEMINMTIVIQQSSTTYDSFVTVINTTFTEDSDVNITAELVLSNGTSIRTVTIDESTKVIEWDNLQSATNYTVQIYTYDNLEKHVLASSWVVTSKYK